MVQCLDSRMGPYLVACLLLPVGSDKHKQLCLEPDVMYAVCFDVQPAGVPNHATHDVAFISAGAQTTHPCPCPCYYFTSTYTSQDSHGEGRQGCGCGCPEQQRCQRVIWSMPLQCPQISIVCCCYCSSWLLSSQHATQLSGPSFQGHTCPDLTQVSVLCGLLHAELV
jgi:hypothetical protein